MSSYDPRMAVLTVTPNTIKGILQIPPSKSHTLRAIQFAAFASGQSSVINPLMSPDTEKMISACEQFGAHFIRDGKSLVIIGNHGKIPAINREIDVGNSGIALRFLTAMAALGSTRTTLYGDASLCGRPMRVLGEALESLGVSIQYHKQAGYAPLTVCGPIKKSRVKLNGEDSQPISALLIAASLLGRDFDIHVNNPGEKPWIEMTLHWLKVMNVQVTCDDYRHYKVRGEGWPSFQYSVPGDWSTAAFPIAAALVTKSKL